MPRNAILISNRRWGSPICVLQLVLFFVSRMLHVHTLTFDGRLHPLKLQEYPDGFIIRHVCDLRRQGTSDSACVITHSRRTLMIFGSHLKNDTFHHFAVFLALLFRLSLQVFVHLSSAHHVLHDKHKALGPSQTWYGDGLQLVNKLICWHLLGNITCDTHPQQDHFGRVFEDLSERVGFRLLGSIGWLDGNKQKSAHDYVQQ